MATELERLKAQLAAMQALPLGVLSVRFEDQQVTYSSADDLIKAMEYLRKKISQIENPGAPRARVALADFRCRYK